MRKKVLSILEDTFLFIVLKSVGIYSLMQFEKDIDGKVIIATDSILKVAIVFIGALAFVVGVPLYIAFLSKKHGWE